MRPESGIGESAGKELRKDTAFLSDVLDCIQDGISILDCDLNILFVNKTMEKWYAHRLPLMGKKCYEAYHGREEPCEICPSVKTLKTGKQAMEVVPFTGPEGMKGCLELFTYPLRNSNTGRMTGVIEYVRDITERKRVEEAWRESEERFRRLSEASFEGIAIHDGGKILVANRAFADMFGYELSDVPGMNRMDLVAPEYRDFLLKEEEPYEAVCLKKNRTTFICMVRGKEIPYQGRTAGVSAIRDITERKLAEEALRLSVQQVTDILESISDAFFSLDNQWRFAFVNSQAEKLLHRTREKLMGKNIWEEFPDAVGSMFYEKYHLAMERSVAVSFEEYYPPFDTWYGVRAYPYRGGLSVYFHDVTERKRAEAQLKKFADELQRSNRELEEFAAVASHDLQSPLISVLSALSLLERHSRDRLGPVAEEYLTSIRDRVTNMVEVIRGMLEYSRVDTAGIAFTRTGLEAVLDRSIGNLMAEIAESGAMVTHDPLPEVSTDAALMAQVFQNLISNAIRFQGSEPPHVHISSERKEGEWLFSVRDNGIGIAPDDTGRIFEVFHSLKAGRKYHGTGIGLATCKKIVQLHGGRIWVESQAGRGSTFFFSIPERKPNQS